MKSFNTPRSSNHLNSFSFWATVAALVVVLSIGSSIHSFATNVTQTITVSGDNFLKKDSRDTNKGNYSPLKTDETNKSHILFRFDQAAIAYVLNGRTLISASLQLYVVQNWGGFTTQGKRVDADRMTGDWTDMGSTWNCPIDTNTSNSNADCAVQWDGGTYSSTATDHNQWFDTTTIGWQSFNVTSDVNLFMSGTSNYGWAVTKTDNWDTGSVDIASKEYSDSTKIPKLVLTIADSPCVITGTPSPTANQYGWNSTNVTVTFVCSDPDGVASCSAPQTLTTEGSNQTVAGQCVDGLGNVVNTSVSVNIDKTTPTVAITAPTTGTTIASSPIPTSGTTSDSTSGIASITCESTTGSFSANTFSCNVPLLVGQNSITVVATDLAGNSSSANVSFVRAAQRTYTFYPTGDTFVEGTDTPGTNYGSQIYLQVKDALGYDNSLVKFSSSDVLAAVGTAPVVSSGLQMYIEQNSGTWEEGDDFDGANFSAYHTTDQWDESSVTWNSWYATYNPSGHPSDTIFVHNTDVGWVTFNVLGDVKLSQSSGNTLSWLISTPDSSSPGELDLTSTQGTAGQTAKLVVTVDDQTSYPPPVKYISHTNPVPDEYIVALVDDAESRSQLDVPTISNNLAMQYGGTLESIYEYALKGFSAHLSLSQATNLSNDPLVKYVEEDAVISITDTPDATEYPCPSINYPIDRINQRKLPLDNSYTTTSNLHGNGVNAYVLDTGIHTSHAKFGSRAHFAINETGEANGDLDGHGTAVAGLLGASNNLGAASGVNLYDVKVCTSDAVAQCVVQQIVNGINWVINPAPGHGVKPAVINMSFGGPHFQVIDDAVNNAINAGFTPFTSAMNDNSGTNDNTWSPQDVDGAICVAASNRTDHRASYSNYGPKIDVFAIGGDTNDGVYGLSNQSNTMCRGWEGTSFSSPQVAGVAALYLQMIPTASVAAVTGAIINTATNAVLTPGATTTNRLLYNGCYFSTLPAQVTLTSPANNATNVAKNVTLTWGAATSTCRYQLHIKPTGGAWTNYYRYVTNFAGLTPPQNWLTGNKTYQWQVRAWNVKGWGQWSILRSFTTAP